MKAQKFYLLVIMGISFQLVKAQVLETEDSQPLAAGQVQMGAGLEFQTSKEGTETALPLHLNLV